MRDKNTIILIAAAVLTIGWLANTWIRAKYGYDLEDSWGRKVGKGDSAETVELRKENARLHDKLDAMQDRMIVLEKIVTDRGYSLAEEIEALRHRDENDAGVPLNAARRENV